MKEYNKKDIKEGMQLRCTDNGGWEHWTTGKNYPVFKNMIGLLVIQSDTGGQREVTDIVQYLNGVSKAKFELLNEEDNKNMYTVGDLVKINDDLQEGIDYDIYCNDEMVTYRGKKAVIVDFYTITMARDNEIKIYKLQDMNGKNIEWSFTDDMFKPTTNTPEQPFKVGDKVRVLNNGTFAWNAEGNLYQKGDIDVVGYVEYCKNDNGGRIRLGTHGSANWIHGNMVELVDHSTIKILETKLENKRSELYLKKQEVSRMNDIIADLEDEISKDRVKLAQLKQDKAEKMTTGALGVGEKFNMYRGNNESQYMVICMPSGDFGIYNLRSRKVLDMIAETYEEVKNYFTELYQDDKIKIIKQ